MLAGRKDNQILLCECQDGWGASVQGFKIGSTLLFLVKKALNSSIIYQQSKPLA
jgi:hypothetical protein